MKILGVDPGSTLIGYGLIDQDKNDNLKELDHGLITIKATTLPEKILLLSFKFQELLDKTKPEYVGIETLFFAKNKKTAFEVAHARGVLLYLLLKNQIPFKEITPNEVKVSVTSYGNADKDQVATMVKKILHLEELKGDDNTSDALAVAIAVSSLIKYEKIKKT
ncbi:MAG: crossover junction endodeoxyribonuclease RuvC [Candidatus Harrisonbacteria bacterium CG10_big_fil_rev_8_21_14_0_10_38_8]|uniref:Crossover junction endodeoxyribonuclease RuvC n=1 Tax=Candidatus Harrisonbacteria bacterium CG10_big_fil_rev_8_21_14_0_10_38_8 TaxID=1974582 RepID=A0A2M6WKK6_9BACT|nr:MAG: crossover junction endodeoxyribonuclease RuvC [Candidatus Harrisonbacteria bacterium CG10_big_fil_rev_8_21_14_0_10_38_8]